jgi:CDP-diacylglycerol--glycerol-3-phosphate 3-phosphatidyltransferase
MSIPVANLQKLNWREVFFLPNMLTLGRLALLPFIFFCLKRPTFASHVAVTILILLAMLLDSLDGYLAHRLNQVTNVGRILDPLVDKISVACGIIFLVVLRDFPLWAAVLIFGRDGVILVLAVTLMKKRALIPSSTLLGKATVTALAGMILLYVVDLQPYARIATYIGLSLVVLSGLGYFLSYLHIVRNASGV